MKKKVWVILVIAVIAVLALLFILIGGKKYTVTFDTDGGNTITSVEVKSGSTLGKPVNPNKEGYTFVRWELNGVEYDFSSKVTSDITLKAIWEEKTTTEDVYNITLDIDGKTQDLKIVNNKITNLPSPSKEGYNFIGWYDGSKKVSVGDTVSKDTKLTAKFEKVTAPNKDDDSNKSDNKTNTDSSKTNTSNTTTTTKYTVTFNSDGGSKVTSQKVSKNSKVSRPKNPTKSGYTFVSWTLNGKEYDFNSKVTKNITLKATWAKNSEVKTYTVTFNSDGGSKVASKKVVDGKTVAKPSNPTKDGYKFLGWYLEDTKYNFDSKVTKNITLKAKWERIVELTYKLEELSGTTVRQAKLFILADGKKVAGTADVTYKVKYSDGKTDYKTYTVNVPESGLIINSGTFDKVSNIKLK